PRVAGVRDGGQERGRDRGHVRRVLQRRRRQRALARVHPARRQLVTVACTAPSRQCGTAYLKRGLPTPDRCRDLVISTFAAAVRLLEEAGIHYWLDYGALLGAVREGGMIPWDNDADVGILLEDWAKLKRLRPAAQEAGFVLRFIKHLDYARAQVSYV